MKAYTDFTVHFQVPSTLQVPHMLLPTSGTMFTVLEMKPGCWTATEEDFHGVADTIEQLKLGAIQE